MSVLINILQSKQIGQVSSKAGAASTKVGALEDGLAVLNDRFEFSTLGRVLLDQLSALELTLYHAFLGHDPTLIS